jgi:hypothetical protein
MTVLPTMFKNDNMGIEDAIKIQQDALERYNKR